MSCNCNANYLIVGVHVTDRAKKAGAVQELLGKYACNIRTRLGLHCVCEDCCSPEGLIVLDLVGEKKVCKELIEALGKIDGVEVKKMSFKH